jgi:mRNA interferase RelE/StbE
MELKFSKKVRHDVKKLDKEVQTRIKKKLLYFASRENPLQYAERLTDMCIGQYRFRIGEYRVIFDVVDGCIEVHKIGHRRDIYQ